MFKELGEFIDNVGRAIGRTIGELLLEKGEDVITGVPKDLSNFYNSIEKAKREGIPMKEISLDSNDEKEIDD